MVSRGGRSRGCSNCRRRRLKCDETRPVCNRCHIRGLECHGPRERTWIVQGHPSLLSRPDEHTTARNTGVPNGIALEAFENDIYVAYTRQHLMKGGLVELGCNMIQGKSLDDDVAQRSGLRLLEKSILCLSITFFGSRNRQKDLTNRGYSEYGNVLRQLNDHLARPHLQTTNETILTAVTCTILELFLPTGPNNYMKHVRGIEAILRLRGPPTSTTGETATIFAHLRKLCIVGSLADSKPSIWASNKFRDAPPPYSDEETLIRHDIFQIMADCTTQMSEPKFSGADDPDSKDYGLLLPTIDSYLEKLSSLYQRWEEHNESMLGPRTSRMDTNFRIANHACAVTYMLYQASYICVLKAVDCIEPSPKHASLRYAAASKIVECLQLPEFQWNSDGAQSNIIGFVSTRLAWDVLGGFTSSEGRKLARIVKAAFNGPFAIGAWEQTRGDLGTHTTLATMV